MYSKKHEKRIVETEVLREKPRSIANKSRRKNKSHEKEKKSEKMKGKKM